MRVAGHTKAAPVAWTRAVNWAGVSMVAALGAGLALAVAQVAGLTPLAQDAAVYYRADLGHLYAAHYAIDNAPYTYSPAFALALEPFRLLPERWFTALWQLGIVGAAIVTMRGWALPILLAGYLVSGLAFLGASDVALGNVFILTGAVAVFGLRYPALWTFAIITKATPGIGLLWFAVRREWRPLGIALGVTGVFVVVTELVLPGSWLAWFRFLAGGQDFPLWVIPVPLWVRIPAAALLVAWGALVDRPWVLPVAAGWVMPIPYPLIAATMLCALGADDGRQDSDDRLRGAGRLRRRGARDAEERPQRSGIALD